MPIDDGGKKEPRFIGLYSAVFLILDHGRISGPSKSNSWLRDLMPRVEEPSVIRRWPIYMCPKSQVPEANSNSKFSFYVAITHPPAHYPCLSVCVGSVFCWTLKLLLNFCFICLWAKILRFDFLFELWHKMRALFCNITGKFLSILVIWVIES